MMEMTWLLTWFNESVATLNATLQVLVIIYIIIIITIIIIILNGGYRNNECY